MGRLVRFKGAPEGRVNHQCVAVNNRLYVIGGSDQIHLNGTNTVAIFDISSNQWLTGPSMRFRRQGFSVVVANGKIFAIGGIGELGRACEVLDVENSPNRWEDISSMNYAREGCAAAVFNNHIIVSGGHFPNGQITATTEIYDIETDSWLHAENMKIPRCRHQLVVIPRDDIEESAADSVLKKYSF